MIHGFSFLSFSFFLSISIPFFFLVLFGEFFWREILRFNFKCMIYLRGPGSLSMNSTYSSSLLRIFRALNSSLGNRISIWNLLRVLWKNSPGFAKHKFMDVASRDDPVAKVSNWIRLSFSCSRWEHGDVTLSSPFFPSVTHNWKWRWSSDSLC